MFSATEYAVFKSIKIKIILIVHSYFMFSFVPSLLVYIDTLKYFFIIHISVSYICMLISLTLELQNMMWDYYYWQHM